MSRFTILEKEINKGIAVDEKSNITIQNWSPNNVRRLILGVDYAIVHYFVTGGKYSHSIEVVNYRRGLENDLQTLQTEPKKYIGLLKVLTSGRICSSVEEIVICTKDYPQQLLSLDADLGLLISNGAGNPQDKLENRFVRLRHISTINCSVQELYNLTSDTRQGTQLLMDQLVKKGAIHVVEAHKEDWYKGTYLRSKLYSMDAPDGLLDKYFKKVEAELDALNRQSKLDDLDKKKNLDIMHQNYPAIDALIKALLANYSEANQIFESQSVTDKLKWAMFLSKDSQKRVFSKELLNSNQTLLLQVKSLDIQGTVPLIEQLGYNSATFTDFISFLFTDILANETQHVRDKLTICESVKALIPLIQALLNIQVNIYCLALLKYLTQYGDEQEKIRYMISRTDMNALSELNYTRSTVEYLNTVFKPNLAKSCFNILGSTEVPVADFKVGAKLDTIKTIAQVLSKINQRK